MLEKFSGGYPDGVESLLVGRIRFGEPFGDVKVEIGKMKEGQKKALVLLVACDRIWGFFEDRGGVANGPRLKELVRGLAEELKLESKPSSRGDTSTKRSREDGLLLRQLADRNDDADVSGKEARGYYDELVQMGVMDSVDELGTKSVFCTVWKVISEYVTAEEGCTLAEVLSS